MKKLSLFTVAICIVVNSFGQQFSFQMNFVDSLGYTDSLILGYDDLATDSIDPTFGEISIIPWVVNGVEIDVRATDNMNQLIFPSFTTKKQIVNNHCGQIGVSIIELGINTPNWPVTATWNRSLFNDTCRNGSFFTSINPAGWWNSSSPSDLGVVPLVNTNQVIFSPNSGINSCDSGYCYFHVGGMYITRFWLVFGDSTLLPTSISKSEINKHSLELFPNPTSSQFTIKTPNGFGKISLVDVYSSIGNILMSSKNVTTVDMSTFENGMYFIIVTNDRGEKLTGLALKSNSR